MKISQRFFGIVLILGLSGFFLAQEGKSASDWPVFHGPRGDNLPQETGLLQSWSPQGPSLLWKCDRLGRGVSGYSTVAISEGMIFTSGNVEEKAEKEGESTSMIHSTVFALDAETGSVLWTYNNGPGWNDVRNYPGTRSTPTVDGDYVYDESPLGQLVCLEKKTGKKIWDRNILEDFEGKNPQWALAESVRIDGENLICSPGGTRACVAALNKKTGETVWTTPGTGRLASYATPYIFEFEGQRIIAVMDQEGLLGVDAETGAMLFYFSHHNKWSINAAIPYYFEGHLLLTSGYDQGAKLLKLRKENGEIQAEEIWNQKFLDLQHGSVVILDGYLYGSSFNGIWVCIRLRDGEILWRNRGIGKGACIYADNRIYAVDEASGTVALFEANPEKYVEISRFSLPEEGEGNFWAHPVICGKRLYLRHGVFLYCFDISR